MRNKIKEIIQRDLGLTTTASFDRTYREDYSRKEFQSLINYIYEKVENGEFTTKEYKDAQGKQRMQVEIKKGDSEIQLYAYHDGEEYSHLRLSRILKKEVI